MVTIYWFQLTLCFHYVDSLITEGCVSLSMRDERSFIFLNLLIWDWQFYFVSNIKHTDKLRRNIQSETQKNKLLFFLVLHFSVQISQNLPPNCFQHYFIQSESFGLKLRIPVGVCECPQLISNRIFFLILLSRKVIHSLPKIQSFNKIFLWQDYKKKGSCSR